MSLSRELDRRISLYVLFVLYNRMKERDEGSLQMVKRWMKMIQIYLWGISNHLLNLTFPGWNKTQVSSMETHSISLKWSGNWCEVLFFSCLIVSNLDYKFMRIPINYWWNAFWLYSIGYLDNYCLGKPNHTGYLLEIYIVLFLQLRFQKKRYEKIDNKVFLGYFVLFLCQLLSG